MDAKFHPAIAAIKADDLQRLHDLVRADPTLATSRSSRSHPTLLQGLVVDATNSANKCEMARPVVAAAAELNGPLSARTSWDNVVVAEVLRAQRAPLNAAGA